jgi:hypothetical protein
MYLEIVINKYVPVYKFVKTCISHLYNEIDMVKCVDCCTHTQNMMDLARYDYLVE